MTIAVKVALNPSTTNQYYGSVTQVRFNSLPNNKFLDLSKLKSYGEDKINVSEKLEFVLKFIENIVGKGLNAGYLQFHLCPQCFQKVLSQNY